MFSRTRSVNVLTIDSCCPSACLSGPSVWTCSHRSLSVTLHVCASLALILTSCRAVMYPLKLPHYLSPNVSLAQSLSLSMRGLSRLCLPLPFLKPSSQFLSFSQYAIYHMCFTAMYIQCWIRDLQYRWGFGWVIIMFTFFVNIVFLILMIR